MSKKSAQFDDVLDVLLLAISNNVIKKLSIIFCIKCKKIDL